MQFESQFRSAFSNQSLRLYNNSVLLIVRAVGFHDSAKSAKMTAELTVRVLSKALKGAV